MTRGPSRVVVVPLAKLKKLRRDARKRRTTEVGLAREIICAAIDGKLVNAIIDDDAKDGRTRAARAAAAKRTSPVKRGKP